MFTITKSDGYAWYSCGRQLPIEIAAREEVAAFLQPFAADDAAYCLWVCERDEDENIVEQMNGEEWMRKRATMEAMK